MIMWVYTLGVMQQVSSRADDALVTDQVGYGSKENI